MRLWAVCYGQFKGISGTISQLGNYSIVKKLFVAFSCFIFHTILGAYASNLSNGAEYTSKCMSDNATLGTLHSQSLQQPSRPW